jgi:hypothetical protein
MCISTASVDRPDRERIVDERELGGSGWTKGSLSQCTRERQMAMLDSFSIISLVAIFHSTTRRWASPPSNPVSSLLGDF